MTKAHCSEDIFLGKLKTINFTLVCFQFLRKTAKNGLLLFSSAKPHYKVLFCKLCPVYRYTVSFSSSSNCALYCICQINIFYLIYKFEVNSLVHSSKVLSSWKEYTCGEPIGRFFARLHREGLWPNIRRSCAKFESTPQNCLWFDVYILLFHWQMSGKDRSLQRLSSNAITAKELAR